MSFIPGWRQQHEHTYKAVKEAWPAPAPGGGPGSSLVVAVGEPLLPSSNDSWRCWVQENRGQAHKRSQLRHPTDEALVDKDKGRGARKRK